MDNSFREVLLTCDPQAKYRITKEYFVADLLKLVRWKDTISDKMIEISKAIPKDFADTIGKHVEITDSVREELIPLNYFNDPFSDTASEPFDFKKFLTSLTFSIPKDSLGPITTSVMYYQTYFCFSKQVKWFEEYYQRFEAGDIPNEIFFKPNLATISSSNSSPTLSPQQSPDQSTKRSNISAMNTDSSVEARNLGMIKIEADPLLHQNEEKPSQDERHHTFLSMGNLVWPKKNGNKPKTSHLAPPPRHERKPVQDPDRQFVDEYNQFVENIEKEEKEENMSQNDVILARMKQKLMILQHESQILKENFYIVSKQKEEMVQSYENHIKELIKQNSKLVEENSRLRSEKSAPSQTPNTYNNNHNKNNANENNTENSNSTAARNRKHMP